MKLERDDGGFLIDAALLGDLLNISPTLVHGLMRQNRITSLCERGEGEHDGQYRLTFFYGGRKARLSVDEAGAVIRRSIVDIGDPQLSSERGLRDKTTPGAQGKSSLGESERHQSPAATAASRDRLLRGDARCERDTSARGLALTFVGGIMARARDRLVTLRCDAPLTEAAERLYEPTRRMVVVCDEKNRMMGVITRTDIIRRIRHCQGCACAARCEMVMTKEVVFCRPQDRLDEAWTIMNAKGLHSVPVVDARGHPIGLLSARDALESLLESLEYEEGLLRDYVMCVGYR